MEPTNPPSVPPVPQMRPLPQPQVPQPPTPPGMNVAKVGLPPLPGAASGPNGEGPTIDEAPGDAAVQLSIWQHPFVQNIVPLLTSLVVHAAIIVFAIGTYKVIQVTRPKDQEQLIDANASIVDAPEGGIPHPGTGGDPNRDAAQDKVLDVPPDSQGINDKAGKDLSTALSGGGSGDSADSIIGLSANGTGMGSGKGTGSGKGDGTGSGSGDGGALAVFGMPGGGGGIGPKSTFVGVSGNARKIVYVLDATGSMMSSFDALRVQLRTAVQNLRPPQSFDIVFINEHNPPPLAPALLFTTPENKRKAQEYVDTMAPRGGTNPLPAITKAFELQPEMIFLLIDPSDFPDKQAVIDLVAKQNTKSKIKLNILAFEGKDAENEKFLKDLATQSGGVYRFITEKDLAGE